MLNSIEIFLLQHAISAATGPEARAYLVAELKKTASGISNPVLKAVLVAIEATLT